MKITLIAVGKLKEEYLKKAAARFSEEIRRHCGFECIEIPDESSESLPPETVMAIEGEGILKRVRPQQHDIALAIRGRQRTAEDFAVHLRELNERGRDDLVFIIGGSLGLSDAVLNRADEKLSFSPMTFPHQLMRVMLMEQLALHL